MGKVKAIDLEQKEWEETAERLRKDFGLPKPKHIPVITRQMKCRACGKTVTKRKQIIGSHITWECQELDHRDKLWELIAFQRNNNIRAKEIKTLDDYHQKEVTKLSKTREYD